MTTPDSPEPNGTATHRARVGDSQTPAPEHLADAKLHLQRATLAIKNASRAEPTLVVQLGTPHAQLVEVLARLEQVTHA